MGHSLLWFAKQSQEMTMETQPIHGNAHEQFASTEQRAGEYLSFRLGAEEYGIDILKVQEIRGFETSTRMVNAPRHVLGVLNLRGVIVPILDMRIKFGMTDVPYDSQTVTIVLHVANRVVGMVVDAVSDVLALTDEDIKPAPGFSGAIGTQHVIGIATVEQNERQRMLILLNIEQLMSSADMGMVSQSIQ
jgi:purine-binding chemotaxis protein CheW